MRCRLSPTADVPSHTFGAAMCHLRTLHVARAVHFCAGQLEARSEMLVPVRGGVAFPAAPGLLLFESK